MDAVSRQTWVNVPGKGGKDAMQMSLRERVLDARQGSAVEDGMGVAMVKMMCCWRLQVWEVGW